MSFLVAAVRSVATRGAGEARGMGGRASEASKLTEKVKKMMDADDYSFLKDNDLMEKFGGKDKFLKKFDFGTKKSFDITKSNGKESDKKEGIIKEDTPKDTPEGKHSFKSEHGGYDVSKADYYRDSPTYTEKPGPREMKLRSDVSEKDLEQYRKDLAEGKDIKTLKNDTEELKKDEYKDELKKDGKKVEKSRVEKIWDRLEKIQDVTDFFNEPAKNAADPGEALMQLLEKYMPIKPPGEEDQQQQQQNDTSLKDMRDRAKKLKKIKGKFKGKGKGKGKGKVSALKSGVQESKHAGDRKNSPGLLKSEAKKTTATDIFKKVYKGGKKFKPIDDQLKNANDPGDQVMQLMMRAVGGSELPFGGEESNNNNNNNGGDSLAQQAFEKKFGLDGKKNKKRKASEAGEAGIGHHTGSKNLKVGHETHVRHVTLENGGHKNHVAELKIMDHKTDVHSDKKIVEEKKENNLQRENSAAALKDKKIEERDLDVGGNENPDKVKFSIPKDSFLKVIGDVAEVMELGGEGSELVKDVRTTARFGARFGEKSEVSSTETRGMNDNKRIHRAVTKPGKLSGSGPNVSGKTPGGQLKNTQTVYDASRGESVPKNPYTKPLDVQRANVDPTYRKGPKTDNEVKLEENVREGVSEAVEDINDLSKREDKGSDESGQEMKNKEIMLEVDMEGLEGDSGKEWEENVRKVIDSGKKDIEDLINNKDKYSNEEYKKEVDKLMKDEHEKVGKLIEDGKNQWKIKEESEVVRAEKESGLRMEAEREAAEASKQWGTKEKPEKVIQTPENPPSYENLYPSGNPPSYESLYPSPVSKQKETSRTESLETLEQHSSRTLSAAFVEPGAGRNGADLEAKTTVEEYVYSSEAENDQFIGDHDEALRQPKEWNQQTSDTVLEPDRATIDSVDGKKYEIHEKNNSTDLSERDRKIDGSDHDALPNMDSAKEVPEGLNKVENLERNNSQNMDRNELRGLEENDAQKLERLRELENEKVLEKIENEVKTKETKQAEQDLPQRSVSAEEQTKNEVRIKETEREAEDLSQRSISDGQLEKEYVGLIESRADPERPRQKAIAREFTRNALQAAKNQKIDLKKLVDAAKEDVISPEKSAEITSWLREEEFKWEFRDFIGNMRLNEGDKKLYEKNSKDVYESLKGIGFNKESIQTFMSKMEKDDGVKAWLYEHKDNIKDADIREAIGTRLAGPSRRGTSEVGGMPEQYVEGVNQLRREKQMARGIGVKGS